MSAKTDPLTCPCGCAAVRTGLCMQCRDESDADDLWMAECHPKGATRAQAKIRLRAAITAKIPRGEELKANKRARA